MAKTALITGITGQDGSYLAEFLLEKGYSVVGMVRRSSTVNFTRIEHIQDDITIVSGDLLDQGSLMALLREYRPTEVYNLAAQSFVPTSWQQPVFTGEVTALGVTPSHVQAALRANNYLAAVGSTKGSMVTVNLTANTDLRSAQEFRDLVVRQQGNTLIRLGDVADVVLGAEDYDQDVRFGGKSATFMPKPLGRSVSNAG